MAGSGNTVMKLIYDVGMKDGKLGEASAMGIVYLLLLFLILGAVIGIVNKFVFYEDR